MNKKKTVSTIAALVVAGSVLVTPVHAASGGWMGGNFLTNLETFIAQKFGLDKTQVQTAVQQFKQQQKATITPRPILNPSAWAAQQKNRLSKLVSKNLITQTQADSILAELVAVHAQYPVTSTTSSADRKTQMTAIQAALKSWAQANGINPQYVMGMGPGMGMGGGHGFGRRGGPRPPTPTVTP